jgi:DNA-binding transcriptional ArsR family regulator
MIKSDSDAARASFERLEEVARLGKALGSPVRLRLLDGLRDGPRSVEDLAAAAGVTVANSSRHLQQMRAAHIVAARRDGRHVLYHLTDAGVSRVVAALRALAERLLPAMAPPPRRTSRRAR